MASLIPFALSDENWKKFIQHILSGSNQILRIPIRLKLEADGNYPKDLRYKTEKSIVHLTIQDLPLKGDPRPKNLQSQYNLVTLACITGENEASVLENKNPFIQTIHNNISKAFSEGKFIKY